MFKRPCNEPGCPELVAGKDSRCPAHKKKYNKEREQWRRDRDPNYRTLFDSQQWSTKRAEKLAKSPVCEWSRDGNQCDRQATVVQPIDRQADNVMADENLKGLCSSHHAGDTRRAWQGQGAP